MDDFTIEDGGFLGFTASATDLNGDDLHYSLAGTIPAGATITPDGVFSWTPTNAQIGHHTFDLVVSDGQTPPEHDQQTITIEVRDARIPLVGQAELVAVMGEVDFDGTIVHGGGFELTVQRDDLTENSRVYYQMPGSNQYSEADSDEFSMVDHDSDPITAPVAQLNSIAIASPASSNLADYNLSNYHNRVRGTWTVYLDIDGDFKSECSTGRAHARREVAVPLQFSVACLPADTSDHKSDGGIEPCPATKVSPSLGPCPEHSTTRW